jgi:hypothetical protein
MNAIAITAPMANIIPNWTTKSMVGPAKPAPRRERAIDHHAGLVAVSLPG